MKKSSAGLLVYRYTQDGVEVILGHMGGPWFAKKDRGAWSIPKGLIEEGEELLNTAKREFSEELGLQPPEGNYLELGTIEQHNNKNVVAWAVEADIDVTNIKSNTFEMQWPPKSGKIQEFPEIDRAGWFSLAQAAQKAVKGQAQLFETLAEKLNLEFKPLPVDKVSEQKSLF